VRSPRTLSDRKADLPDVMLCTGNHVDKKHQLRVVLPLLPEGGSMKE